MNNTTTTIEPGYVCKRCDGPAPLGVGYVSYDPEVTYAQSKDLTSCECGYSQKP